ncbi:FAD-dependent monooxygenase [Flavobacteriales bacterium]|nr:FAD-dependent monooxygenase [Flavobacteriales bacterium]
MKKATIVGAGLAGSLWAVYLAKAGYKVTIIEMRGDLRKTDISAGKSINLALSKRGWTAFENVNVQDEIHEIATPMYGRTMHASNGELTEQAYGQEGQAIYSVPRAGINCKMMDLAEKHGDAEILYHKKCVKVDLKNAVVTVEDTKTGEVSNIESDVVFGCDGAFSAVRYTSMQKVDRFNFSQTYIADGYREILLPANADGSYKLDKNRLHIWPRGRFMMIALANLDGSFTCTLFMPHDEGDYNFNNLTSAAAVDGFFKEVFPDFYEMMPNIGEAWGDHPLSSLAITRCYPWHHGKTVLMGDAAHATVPFYGQGMNCSLEDCSVMWELMQKHNEDWEKVFEEFSRTRKADGDGLQDLSLHNYHVMRDYVADPKFLLQKKFEARIEQLYPDKYTPLYSQVSFTNIPYSEAWTKGMAQDKMAREIVEKNDVQSMFDDSSIDGFIHQLATDGKI